MHMYIYIYDYMHTYRVHVHLYFLVSGFLPPRPSLIQFMYSSQLVLRGIVLQNPAFWNTHFYASGNVLAAWLMMGKSWESILGKTNNIDIIHIYIYIPIYMYIYIYI